MSEAATSRVLSVREAYARVKRLTGAQVCARVGHGFLLERKRPTSAAALDGAGTLVLSKAQLESAYEPPARQRNVIVLPPEGQPPMPEWVTIGRAGNTVVRLEHPSVSKLHGVLRLVESGFCVADAGSKNGTWVNGDPVPRYDQGKPRLLRSGDRIALGAYSFIYLGPAEVRAFLVEER